MKILVIGGGGREHAIVKALRRSSQVGPLFCAPGNGGISRTATNVSILATELILLRNFASAEGIDLTVVGPDQPLADGIVNLFQAAGLRIFGPTAQAALLESSKIWCKKFLDRARIPTAPFECFDDPDRAKAYIGEHGAPTVVKADGLCAGKGVVVAKIVKEANDAVDRFMVQREIGNAGARIVIEDCLQGIECSYTVITDGRHVVPLATARDYKQAWDGDRGPNTGGMGSYSPNDHVTPDLEAEIMRAIVYPTVNKLSVPYTGVLYFGLMLTADGPKVLEINCRFGDPETQVILPRLTSDFAALLYAATDGTLNQITPNWRNEAAVCVVAASDGYPGKYATGYTINGIQTIEEFSPDTPDVQVFHAGTNRNQAGDYFTAGGRVLGITALRPTIQQARDHVYTLLDGYVNFTGMKYRSDIAAGVEASGRKT